MLLAMSRDATVDYQEHQALEESRRKHNLKLVMKKTQFKISYNESLTFPIFLYI